jgi:histidinol-phosphate aminotransferase
MYRFYADVQGIEMIDAPLLRDNDFAFDTDAILAACRSDTKLIFVCSPNNPTGGMVSTDDILQIVDDRRGKSIVVVDEAYIEFSGRESLACQTGDYENLVVLRTLSKAQALAGARCGAAIANEAIVAVMSRVLPPYSFPTPVIDCVLKALSGEQVETSQRFVAGIISERERLAEQLDKLGIVQKIWTSHANFLLARIEDLARVQNYLHSQGILIRDFGDRPGLVNCARITIGSREENTALLAAMSAYEENR